MKFLFMDEKGPQNSFKISSPFNNTNKLSYATDNMHSYVVNVIQIDEVNYINIERNYKKIVNEYLSNRPQLKESLSKKGKELKGFDLVKSNFKYGISSMKNDEIKFYMDILNLLLKYNVENLLFLISKMSIITSSRLINFFYFLEFNTGFSAYFVKYSITKYAEIEASEKVIKALLDKSISTKNILELIRDDITTICQKNFDNSRMSIQIDNYKNIIMAINLVLDCGTELKEPDISLSFDWSKVKWAFDLWMSEQRLGETENQWWLFLDEGIPKDIFTSLDFYKVDSDCDSSNYIGLQITDMIAVLIGKFVSQLNLNTKYDFDNPDRRVLISENYYKFSKEQYDFIKKLNQFILNRKGKYHFINDSYFDDSVLLETYIRYISSYDTFENYNKVKLERHSELHLKDFIYNSEMKFIEAMKNEYLLKECYVTIDAAVEEEMFRPL